MKYQDSIGETKDLLSAAENVLITLVKNPTIDELSAGLAVYLALEQSGKKASIATDGIIRVGHSNLFGINQIQSEIPAPNGGNLTIVLGNVVDSTTQKPITLQELKWHPEGSDLHLVFYPVPGQRFEPTHITPGYEGAKYEVIIVIGATSLEELGTVYKSKPEVFSQGYLLNIDNKLANTKFGNTNIVDSSAATISEMIEDIIPFLGFPVEGDAATNLLIGIYGSTDNLKSSKVQADTFMSIAAALKAGGKRPEITDSHKDIIVVDNQNLEETKGNQDLNTMSFNQSVQSNPIPPRIEVFKKSNVLISQPLKNSQLTSESKLDNSSVISSQPSPEETPHEEVVEHINPESDWLTPKIFKGSTSIK